MGKLSLQILIFFIGLMCIAFGVATISNSQLGTTPIAAIPFSLSFVFPNITFGTWLVLFNFTLIVLEFCILKGKMRLLAIFIQCLIVCIFGTCVDLSVWLTKLLFSPHHYTFKIFLVILGSLIIALGAVLTIRSNIALFPIEGFLMAVSQVSAIDFSRLRVLSDICMSVIAALITIIGVHTVAGVREGTILASLATGPFIKLFLHLFREKK